jgi:2-keto-3-deoxy-galactonokinase
MTGEVFAVLEKHSILGRLMEEFPADEAAFERGIRLGIDGTGLLGRLSGAAPCR